ncbi:MAG: M48 family metallopeptidase [Calditrichaeota bacterium]|nr:M48 family metallopeptidase [Calditrichota bacterium]MCB9369583.1 M48 family metallopeptidase [Calditrichota bacterium]
MSDYRRDFAAEIRSNKRKSMTLFIGLPLLLLILCWVIGRSYGFGDLGLPVGFIVAVSVMLISYFLGDDIVLGFTGAREATWENDQMLFNVVDEMRIAAGLPMPRVYVIDSFALNAFATGWSPETAAVCVTRGLLEKLNREELQGVIGHEMGHVANLDIRYMLLVSTMVGAIALIADGYRRSMWYGSGRMGRSASKGSSRGAFLIIGIVLSILAPFAALVMQASISRKREYLADATSARLTRNPLGLANALAKIEQSMFVNPLPWINRATVHLFIINPLRNDEMSKGLIFSTHPPTKDRIQRLRAMANLQGSVQNQQVE